MTVLCSVNQEVGGISTTVGVRAGGGGAGGLQPPQILGNSDFVGQREKIWAKSVSKDVSMFI